MTFIKKIVVTDLDGTLLRSNKIVSDIDLNTLIKLKESDILRVIATGRSLYSAKKVLDIDFPIDYLIFSSGAGIIDWRTKEIIKAQHLSILEVGTVYNHLNSLEVDFTIQKKIPFNHECLVIRKNRDNPDFMRRIEIYKDFCKEYLDGKDRFDEACQFIIIVSEHKGVAVYSQIKKVFCDLNVIRATSPLDGKSIWIEIFPVSVSKANAANWLANKFQIDQTNSFAIGNDYNDLGLLNWANHSLVVENAPLELKKSFKTTNSCDSNGFSMAVSKWKLI